MCYYISRLAWPLFGVAILSAPAPEQALGQEAAGTFVAVTDAFPDIGARAMVVREGRREVVVLRADEATPETLAMSLQVLERAREREPAPRNGEMIPITGFVLTTELPAERRAALEDVLVRLAARPLVSVEPFGSGRWLPLEVVR